MYLQKSRPRHSQMRNLPAWCLGEHSEKPARAPLCQQRAPRDGEHTVTGLQGHSSGLERSVEAPAACKPTCEVSYNVVQGKPPADTGSASRAEAQQMLRELQRWCCEFSCHSV